MQWTEYSEHTKRVQYSTVPTRSITAKAVTVDGMVLTQTDGRGNNGECDHMGCRAIKRVMVNDNVTLHQRYIYRGYLQIACIDLTRSHHPALWYITWDPTQNIATRPLAIQKDGTWYTYGWDLTKNICEVHRTNGTLGTSYTYTPYGLPSQSTNGAAAGGVEQPIQWSSEYNDTELGLTYYNYRHYNPAEGRWIRRDKEIQEKNNIYCYVLNFPALHIDLKGNITMCKLCAIKLPKPTEPIFLYLYENKGGGTSISYVTQDDINLFYTSAFKLHNKRRNKKRCYQVRIKQDSAATEGDLNRFGCDIIFIIGHGQKIDGHDYVKLKDGNICISNYNKNGIHCEGIGCYISGEKGTIPHTYALRKLAKKIQNLYNSPDCPGKTVCVFSGPVNV